jgi:hypothetical protein
MDSLVACIGGQLGAQCPLIGGPFGPLGVHLPDAGPPVQTLPVGALVLTCSDLLRHPLHRHIFQTHMKLSLEDRFQIVSRGKRAGLGACVC